MSIDRAMSLSLSQMKVVSELLIALSLRTDRLSFPIRGRLLVPPYALLIFCTLACCPRHAG